MPDPKDAWKGTSRGRPFGTETEKGTGGREVVGGGTQKEYDDWLSGAGRDKPYPLSGSDQSGGAYGKPSGFRTTTTGRYTTQSRTPGPGRMGNNPFVTFSVTSNTIRPVLASLTAEIVGSAQAAQFALVASAKKIQAQARQNVRPYRYTGRLHGAIQVRASPKNDLSKGFGLIRVTVGIHSRTFAPEGATFERGWFSQGGKTPPSEPFAMWAQKRRIAKNPKDAAKIGFLIARKMGERPGYTFGTRPWLGRAYDSEKAMVEPTVARYMMSTWGSAPRGPGGRFL